MKDSSSPIRLSKGVSDELRGIAIILITLGHCAGDFTRVLTPLGGIGVAIFLILSGFGLNESLKNRGSSNFRRSFWLKRINRVWLPYFVLISLVCLIGNLGIYQFIQEASWFGASFWYVQYILLCYVAFWLTSFIRNVKIRIGCLVILSLLSGVLMSGVRGEQYLSFTAGVILSSSNIVLNKTKFFGGKWVILLGILGLSFLALKQTEWYRINEMSEAQSSQVIVNFVQSLVKFPFAIAIILSVLLYKRIQQSESTLLIWLGGISYELYLVQMLLYKNINGELTIAIYVIISSILLAYVFNLLTKAIDCFLLKNK